MPTQATCRVCGSTVVTPLVLEEQMFGTREQFAYHECAACRSLSIADVPADLGRHYPGNYYSFTADDRRPRLGGLARRAAVTALLHMPAALGRRLPANMSVWRAMNRASVRRSTAILDVGSGNGTLLRSLDRSGFTDLHGVDPFVERSTASGHVTINKGELADMTGTYGFILLNHSLEHMPDPRATLHELERLCAPGGHVMIGLPVVNRSWADFGPDWIGLDPPRHLLIPSVSGLTGLIESIPGLRVKDTWFDTTDLEFYGTALAAKRVPLFDAATGQATDPAQHFDEAQRAAWRSQARDYNKRGEAGTASFLIERVN